MTLFVSYFCMAIPIQYALIIALRRLQAFQAIYSLSPQSHQSKHSTPSFGGIAIYINIILGCILFQAFSPTVNWLLLLMLSFCLIGAYDDILSKLKKSNLGLKASHKFVFQLILSLLLLALFHIWIRPLSWLDFGFYSFLIVGSSNATNLSDGLDGLLGGLSLLTLLGFGIFCYIHQIESLLLFSSISMGAIFVFLLFNFYPAKVFMGDTGSLAIGALFAGLSLTLNQPWILLPFGAVYVIETLSVILQVLRYKLSQKRIFLMAPLHHHFELLGLHERYVSLLFWLLSSFFIGLYYLLKHYL